MIDSKLRSRIIAALRHLTFSYPPRNKVKKSAQVGPATFQCKGCGSFVYEGTRELADLDFLTPEQKANTTQGKIHLDHILAVIDPKQGWVSWDEYINRLFCDEDGYQPICAVCHKKKTLGEHEDRKVTRQRNKKLTGVK